MNLANPLALLGLLALPVIFALHLLRARRVRYTISSLSLWSFLEEEVRGSVAHRIPTGWLLVLDLLAALFITLAWAGPQIPRPVLAQPPRQLALLLDVSTSMNASDTTPSRFELARAAVLEELRGLRGRDTAVVIAFGAHTRLIGDTRQIGLDELVARVQAIKAGETGSNLREALSSAYALRPTETLVFTDGAFPPVEADGVRWRQFGRQGENQAVLDLSAGMSPAGETEVFARVVNFGARSARRAAILLVDGQPYDQVTLQLEPGAEITRAWRIPGQPGLLTLKLDGRDDLTDDDQASLGLTRQAEVRIALVTDQPAPLDRALRAVPGARVTVLSPREYQPGLDYDLTVFRGVLPADWPAGNILVFDPPEGSPLLPVRGSTDAAGQTVVSAALSSGLDFSGVVWGPVASLAEVPAGFTVLARVGSSPLFLHGHSGSSQISVLLSDLSSGNLARHPALPVLIASEVAAAGTSDWPGSLLAGKSLSLPPAGRYASIQITAPDGGKQEWGLEPPPYWLPLSGPGVYGEILVTQTGEKRQVVFGVNAGSTEESDTRPRAAAEEVSGEAQEQARLEDRPLNLAPWLLGIALLVLLVEAWLAWR